MQVVMELKSPHNYIRRTCCGSRLALHHQICLACVWELVKDIMDSKACTFVGSLQRYVCPREGDGGG